MTSTSTEPARRELLADIHRRLANGMLPRHRLVSDAEGVCPLLVALVEDRMDRVLSLAASLGGVVNLFVPLPDNGFVAVGMRAIGGEPGAGQVQPFNPAETVGLFLEHLRVCGSEVYRFSMGSVPAAPSVTSEARVVAYV